MTPEQREELKPCPFCGNQSPELEDHRLLWCVSCSCGANVLGDKAPEPNGHEPAIYWDSLKGSAVGRWNGRAQVEALTVPQGYRIVPVEPTEDMIVAFAEQWYIKVRCIDDCEMEDCYAAMLAAAPTIPDILGTKEGL